jgi:hypothetical protein
MHLPHPQISSVALAYLVQRVEDEGEGGGVLLRHSASVMMAQHLQEGEVGLGNLPA